MIEEYLQGALLLSQLKKEHEAVKTSLRSTKTDGRLIFIGNGGSFQGHIAHDYLKVGNIPTLTPDSPSLLTCLANDYPKEDLFKEWVKRVWVSGDILIAVSSSGKSQNIINAIEWVKENTCGQIITFTGFDKDNPIKQLGHINVYFDTTSYGVHECFTQVFLHSILDDLVKE